MDEDGFAQFASVPNLAHRARVSLEAAQEAVRALESPDLNSSDPDNGGRRIERVPGGWTVLNAEKYRTLVTRLVQREQTRDRVRKHRASKGNDTTVSAPLQTDTCNRSEAEAYTEARSEKTQRARAPLIAKRRKDAAWEGQRVWVPQRLHADFIADRNTPDAETELLVWYENVADEWTTGRCKDTPTGGEMFAFWRARYVEKWPAPVKPSKRLPAWATEKLS
jgi:hypothetical protein